MVGVYGGGGAVLGSGGGGLHIRADYLGGRGVHWVA